MTMIIMIMTLDHWGSRMKSIFLMNHANCLGWSTAPSHMNWRLWPFSWCHGLWNLPLPIPYHQRFIPAKLKWKETTMYTLQGTNISHLEKRKIIFKSALGWDMLVPWRVIKKHVWCSSVLAVERYAQVPSSHHLHGVVVRHAPRHICLVHDDP